MKLTRDLFPPMERMPLGGPAWLRLTSWPGLPTRDLFPPLLRSLRGLREQVAQRMRAALLH